MRTALTQKKQLVVIGLLFLFAFVLRLINIDFSFSNDELSAITRAQQLSFNSLLTNGVLVDGHPAGVQSFLYFWIKLFGILEFAIRLPFAIFGAIAVVFAFLFTQRKFGFTPALLTAFFLSTLEFSLLHSQIARPYSSGLMLSMITIWLWDKVVFPDSKDKKHILVNSLALALLMAANAYNHYFNALFALILGLIGIAFIPKKQLISYLGMGALSMILFLPHLSITITHLSYGGVGEWLSVPDARFFTDHIIYIFNESLLLLIIVIGSIFALSIINKTKNTAIWRSRAIVLFLFIIPIIIGYLYSVYRNPILQDRVLLFTMPFLLMFIFSFVSESKSKIQWVVIFILGIFVIQHTIIQRNYYSKNHFIDFKGFAELTKQTHLTYNEQDILSLQNTNSEKYLQFYLKDKEINFAINEIMTEDELWKLKGILDDSENKYVEYISMRPQNRLVKMMIESRYSENIITYNCIGESEYLFYEKGQFQNLQNIVNTDTLQDTLPFLNSEFSEEIQITAAQNGIYRLQYQFYFKSEKPIDEVLLVFSKEINGNNIEWWSAPLKYFQYQEWSPFLLLKDIEILEGETVKIYLWNPKKENIKVSELSKIISKESNETI